MRKRESKKRVQWQDRDIQALRHHLGLTQQEFAEWLVEIVEAQDRSDFCGAEVKSERIGTRVDVAQRCAIRTKPKLGRRDVTYKMCRNPAGRKKPARLQTISNRVRQNSITIPDAASAYIPEISIRREPATTGGDLCWQTHKHMLYLVKEFSPYPTER